MNDRPEASSILRESSVTVFVNSVAGGGRSPSCLSPIQKLFESFHVDAQFVMTNCAAELEASAQDAISHGQRTLFAMGGDGTFQALANATLGADVVLGVLPVGGGNDFAAALGLRYIASALRALVGFVPIPVRVDFLDSDIPSWEANALLAAVLNSPTYGAGVRLAPEAAVDDGCLHVVLIEDIGALGIMRLLPRLMGSGELRTSRVKRWQVKKVRLTTHQTTAFHGDGEIIGSTPVEIEVVPRAIQILAPAQR